MNTANLGAGEISLTFVLSCAQQLLALKKFTRACFHSEPCLSVRIQSQYVAFGVHVSPLFSFVLRVIVLACYGPDPIAVSVSLLLRNDT
jgi:hypothetical protein